MNTNNLHNQEQEFKGYDYSNPFMNSPFDATANNYYGRPIPALTLFNPMSELDRNIIMNTEALVAKAKDKCYHKSATSKNFETIIINENEGIMRCKICGAEFCMIAEKYSDENLDEAIAYIEEVINVAKLQCVFKEIKELTDIIECLPKLRKLKTAYKEASKQYNNLNNGVKDNI